MPPKQESDPVRNQTPNQRRSDMFNAWLLGSSVASLASAVYLIRDSKVPASHIHLIETRRTPEDGITTTGDPVSGYDYQAALMPSLSDICIEGLLASVTSAPKAGKDNIGKAKKGPPPMSLLIQCDRELEMMDASTFCVGLKVRTQLAVFMLKPEKSLSGKKINTFFERSFFASKFWALWSTMYGIRSY